MMKEYTRSTTQRLIPLLLNTDLLSRMHHVFTGEGLPYAMVEETMVGIVQKHTVLFRGCLGPALQVSPGLCAVPGAGLRSAGRICRLPRVCTERGSAG